MTQRVIMQGKIVDGRHLHLALVARFGNVSDGGWIVTSSMNPTHGTIGVLVTDDAKTGEVMDFLDAYNAQPGLDEKSTREGEFEAAKAALRAGTWEVADLALIVLRLVGE